MGTTSMIWLKVRKEDYGKVFKADPAKIPTKLLDFNFEPEEVRLPANPGGKLGSELYIGVYCNFDGYHDGVGRELANNYKTYEDVLNLILFGELSCICDYVVSYKCWRNEKQTIYKSEFGRPKSTQEYYYCFDEDYIGTDVLSTFYHTHWTTIPGSDSVIRIHPLPASVQNMINKNE